MRLAGLAVVLAGLCMATQANAAAPLEIATAEITGPGAPSAIHGLEFGALFAIPLPAADITNTEIGLATGLTLTSLMTPHVGAGLDFVYHYWPAGDAFKATFNSLLGRETYGLIELGGTTWRLNVLQMTGHLKFVAPLGGGMRGWLQIGGGPYRIDPNTTGFSGQEGFFIFNVRPLKTRVLGGACGSIGVDLVNSGRMRFGLDASFDHVWSKDDFGSDFDAYAVGGHLLFGR